MVPEYLKKNLDLFRAEEYTVVSDKNTVVPLVEEEEEGAATLEGRFENDSVIFHFPEKRTLPYLDSKDSQNRQESPENHSSGCSCLSESFHHILSAIPTQAPAAIHTSG